MGRIKEQLENFGYNAKERAYIYGGAFVGVMAPIVGARYLLSGSGVIAPENLFGEAIAWGGALLLNATPMVVSPHLPASIYTGGVGTIIGNLAAQNSRRKRVEKERTLENLTQEKTK
jgi:hypothetical protein